MDQGTVAYDIGIWAGRVTLGSALREPLWKFMEGECGCSDSLIAVSQNRSTGKVLNMVVDSEAAKE